MKQKNHFISFFLLAVTTGMGCSPIVPVQTDSISQDRAEAPSPPTPAPTINPLAVFQEKALIYSLSLSPDGRRLALGSTKKIMLWDLDGQGEPRTFEAGAHDVLSLAFSPDGRTLAAGSYLTIDLLDVASGQRVTTLSGHSDYVLALTFNPDGSLLASGSRGSDAAIYIWDVAQGRLMKRLTYQTKHSETVRALAFSANNRWLASAGLDRTIRIWNVLRISTVVHQTLFNPSTTPLTISFSPDQKILASGTWEGPLILYDLTEGRILRTLLGHQGKVLSVAFSPDGTFLISAGADKTIRRWKVATGRAIDTQGLSDEIELGEIARDRRHVAVAGLQGAAVFALEDPKEIPPVITLFSPVDQQTVNTSMIRLTGKVVDDQGPVELKIHVNGIVLGNRSGTGTQSEVSFDEVIRLVAGLNVIEVTANDPEGSSQTETVRITYVPEQGEALDNKDPVEHETESGKNK